MTQSFTDAQIDILARRAITPEDAERAGVLAVQTEIDLPKGSPDYWTVANGYLPGLLFPYGSPYAEPGEPLIYQLRPDTPVTGADGDIKKYVFPPDAPSILHAGRPNANAETALIVEGTCQTIAASTAAPDGVSVYGIAGCQSWMKAGVPTRDLAVVEGREVLIALDADAATNPDVYAAGVALKEACLAEGATGVRFIRVPGGGKSGLDDVLAAKPAEDRPRYLANLIEIARNRPRGEKPDLPAPVKPKARASAGAVSPYFIGEKLQVQTLAAAVVGSRPAALTKEGRIALYSDGVYKIDGLAFRSEITELLGENYRTSHFSNAESFTEGQLAARGNVLPDRLEQPLLNTPSGMVDLRTGELLKHDPIFRSTVQIPIPWQPDATCPTYDAWAKEQIGDQLDDLEESVAIMLDPTVTPTKAVFLFGPSRSGKSTYLRLIEEIAGDYSAVSLHQLSEDRFMAANIFGKMLNVAADLSAAHVEDISIFKMMTGEDPIQANRKYGGQFAFVNRALFAFSANELPTVGESSRAYSERIKPFFFGVSFAGREDATLEPRLRAELPGILVRLVKAHRRRMERGHPLPTDDRVKEMFELASDRVRAFVNEVCEIVPIEPGQGGSKNATISTTTEIYLAFREWTNDEGKASMAKSKMKVRLATVPGVVESISAGKSRGWNVRIRPRNERGSIAFDGTLSVSDLPTTHVHHTSSEELIMESGSDRSEQGEGQNGQSSISSPVAFLAAHAVTVPPPECPDCDRPEELVPPGNFWYACRSCTPATFERS